MDTGQTARLTNLQFPPMKISWSPDGQHIAFASIVPSMLRKIATLPPAPPGAKWTTHCLYWIRNRYLKMKQRERVFTALEHKKPDRVPLFEIWIDEIEDNAS